MKTFWRRCVLLLVMAVYGAHAAKSAGIEQWQIPEPLKSWESWVLRGEEHRHCPTPYFDATKHLCFWPSRLALQIEPTTGRFELGVTVFHESWLALPGSKDVWPMDVLADGQPLVVVEHDGNPSVRLPAGTVKLTGVYRWSEVPQHIPLPRQIGIVALTLDGKTIDAPAWDAQGSLWLKRDSTPDAGEKDFLSVKVYGLLEDGIPIWLRSEIELTVSGKSREEDLGTILPEGWKLAAIESPIPVAVDEAGRLKAQVRAGKWILHCDAFHSNNPVEIRYAAAAKPAVHEQLLAFRPKPEFRMVEIIGVPSIDVSQTTFPEKWRELPVYRWDTAAAFRIEERMRGMGQQKPAGLIIGRELWLDDDGRGLTFRDQISGQMQQIWRLDAAPGQDLGSVRSGGKGQLLTRNPVTGAPGVEIRTRNLDLEATGRIQRGPQLPASGWQADADSLTVSLNLPPGWRLFALFGADWVQGDWLTAWTLLDLFLLLIFSLAVYRMRGPAAAVLAFTAFGLAYHEPQAPRYIWLALLLPLALLPVVPEGWARRLLTLAKWTIVMLFILFLVRFVGSQIQQALYPQLENISLLSRHYIAPPDFVSESGIVANADKSAPADSSASIASPSSGWRSGKDSNLMYDTKARIQTGPGVPEWTWRTVSYGWNSPVIAAQQVRPILIPLAVERTLSLLRVILLMLLAAVLLAPGLIRPSLFRLRGKALSMLLAGLSLTSASSAKAQFPPQAMLDQLRERLLEVSPAYPIAADIPSVSLTINERRVVVEAEIHAMITTAVPLPGKLPAWSPLSVLIDGKPEAALRREDGFLWLVIPQGVHRIRVEGMLPNVTEWEWTFQLRPHQIKIEAPGWTFSGVRADGVPEQQIFFSRKVKTAAGAASYERQDLQAIAVIERSLELGLIWQVRTTVTRLSPAGKALAFRIPLLAGENVLSSNAVVRDGFIEIRLGAQEPSISWESGLAISNQLKLATRAEDPWVERWHVVASPVWNLAISGLPPTFEPASANLTPVWQPWPGESVELTISRPGAIAGATVTISHGTHQINPGKRQRASSLELTLRCSLGEDFLIELPPDADITSLTHDSKPIPVRKDGARLIVPLHPGEQSISVAWKTNTLLVARTVGEAVRLPVESANIQTILQLPEDRWVLWTRGPLRGPAVRFWGILLCSLLAAAVLGRIALSPLRSVEWMLLVIGLTQVPLPAALAVVGWLFFIAWRGRESFQHRSPLSYNFLQLLLILLTAIALCIFIFVVAEGLLGSPEMFISGNDSSPGLLRWYQARSGALLPTPECFSVSIWWYRFFMLAWALWLAVSLIRWLSQAWHNFSSGGFFRKMARKTPTPPPLPLTPEQ